MYYSIQYRVSLNLNDFKMMLCMMIQTEIQIPVHRIQGMSMSCQLCFEEAEGSGLGYRVKCCGDEMDEMDEKKRQSE